MICFLLSCAILGSAGGLEPLSDSHGLLRAESVVVRLERPIRARSGANPRVESPIVRPRETPPISVSFHVPVGERDPWFGYDKLRHVTFSLLATLGTQYVLTEKAGIRRTPAFGLSSGATAAAGVGKEWHDRRAGRFFSFRDLAADAVGIGLAAGIVFL